MNNVCYNKPVVNIGFQLSIFISVMLYTWYQHYRLPGMTTSPVATWSLHLRRQPSPYRHLLLRQPLYGAGKDEDNLVSDFIDCTQSFLTSVRIISQTVCVYVTSYCWVAVPLKYYACSSGVTVFIPDAEWMTTTCHLKNGTYVSS